MAKLRLRNTSVFYIKGSIRNYSIHLLLAALHELDAVLEENISVLVTESLGLVGHLPCVVLDCEPGREANIVLLTRQLHPVQFLRSRKET